MERGTLVVARTPTLGTSPSVLDLDDNTGGRRFPIRQGSAHRQPQASPAPRTEPRITL